MDHKQFQRRIRVMSGISHDFFSQIHDSPDAEGQPIAGVPQVLQGMSAEIVREIRFGDVPAPDILVDIASSFFSASNDISCAAVVLGNTDVRMRPEGVLEALREALPHIRLAQSVIREQREIQVFGHTSSPAVL